MRCASCALGTCCWILRSDPTADPRSECLLQRHLAGGRTTRDTRPYSDRELCPQRNRRILSRARGVLVADCSAIAAIRNEEESSTLGTVYQDRIRALGFRAAYQMHDPFQGSNYMVLNIRQGLDILGGSEKGSVLLSRAGGSREFSKAHLALTRLQKFSEQWSLLLSGAAQVSSTGLLASEEFHLGGAQFGRAFRSGDVGGDGGVGGIRRGSFRATAGELFSQELSAVWVRGYWHHLGQERRWRSDITILIRRRIARLAARQPGRRFRDRHPNGRLLCLEERGRTDSVLYPVQILQELPRPTYALLPNKMTRPVRVRSSRSA